MSSAGLPEPEQEVYTTFVQALAEQKPKNTPGQKPNKLGGMGGIFNIINMHCFAYAGNNPIMLRDPDGRMSNGGNKN